MISYQKVWSTPVFQILPLNLLLLLLVDAGIIIGNLYLYRFLTKHTEERTKSKSEFDIRCCILKRRVLVLPNLDVKKERRKNLIPAKIGVYSILILVFFAFLNGLAHSIPFLDNETRLLLCAIFNDAYYCVLAPALILYGVPSLRRNLSSYVPF